MEKQPDACKALYRAVFPDDTPSFVDMLFDRFGQYVKTVEAEGAVRAMLFSLPALLFTGGAPRAARYLFGVATDPAFRGRGLATRLLAAETDAGEPLFLRPATTALIEFYARRGFQPMNAAATVRGAAEPAQSDDAWQVVGFEEYLAARRTRLAQPFLEMDADFLALDADARAVVGAAGLGIFQKSGQTVQFSEWIGSADAAARAARALGAISFSARVNAAVGEPFAMGYEMPAGAAFLSALDA